LAGGQVGVGRSTKKCVCEENFPPTSENNWDDISKEVDDKPAEGIKYEVEL
jgi:hypothetical protein